MIYIENKYDLRQIIEEGIIDLGEIDVSNITDMSYMFSEIQTINGDISNWDVSNVTDMSCMFKQSELNPDISNWEISNVEFMNETFDNSNISKIPKWYY